MNKNSTAIGNIYNKSILESKNIVWTGKDEERTYFEYHKQRFLTLLKKIKISNNTKILDIGTSHLTLVLKERHPKAEIITLDQNKSWENMLGRNIKQVIFNLKSINENVRFPFDDSYFDTIIFCEVIEHLNMEMGRLFIEFNRILKKGGILYIGTPNYASLINRIKLLIGINPTDIILDKDDYGKSHVREYTLKEILKLTKYGNFDIKRSEYPIYFDTTNSIDRWIIRLKKYIIYPIVLIVPSFRKAMLIEAHKK